MCSSFSKTATTFSRSPKSNNSASFDVLFIDQEVFELKHRWTDTQTARMCGHGSDDLFFNPEHNVSFLSCKGMLHSPWENYTNFVQVLKHLGRPNLITIWHTNLLLLDLFHSYSHFVLLFRNKIAEHQTFLPSTTKPSRRRRQRHNFIVSSHGFFFTFQGKYSTNFDKYFFPDSEFQGKLQCWRYMFSDFSLNSELVRSSQGSNHFQVISDFFWFQVQVKPDLFRALPTNASSILLGLFNYI